MAGEWDSNGDIRSGVINVTKVYAYNHGHRIDGMFRMFLETPRLARACFAFTAKRSMLTLHLCHQSTAWTLKSDREVREVVKKRIFYGQAENFTHFYIEI